MIVCRYRLVCCLSSFVFGVVCDLVFFCKQKTAYEMRISDWSSDVCSSDLLWRLIDHVLDHRGDLLAAERLDRPFAGLLLQFRAAVGRYEGLAQGGDRKSVV